MLMDPTFCVEADTLVLLDDGGNQLGDAYSLSPSQDPREVAAWLTELRRLNEAVGF